MTQTAGNPSHASSVAIAAGEIASEYDCGRGVLICTESPIASVLSNSSKLFLKGGLFDHIPAPSFKSFEQDEPEWLKC
jgi:hypothetical protein